MLLAGMKQSGKYRALDCFVPRNDVRQSQLSIIETGLRCGLAMMGDVRHFQYVWGLLCENLTLRDG
jgi:hypothetical protein